MGLSIKWGSGDTASLGNIINPSHLQSVPVVHLEQGENKNSDYGVATSTTFVLALTDPDAPSRDDPKWSEYCHWIATGLSKPSASTASLTPLLSEVHDVMPYKPPGPPPRTGKHRYVFLVFVPANGTTDNLHLTKPAARKHWGADREGYGVRGWAKENGLVPIGE